MTIEMFRTQNAGEFLHYNDGLIRVGAPGLLAAPANYELLDCWSLGNDPTYAGAAKAIRIKCGLACEQCRKLVCGGGPPPPTVGPIGTASVAKIALPSTITITNNSFDLTQGPGQQALTVFAKVYPDPADPNPTTISGAILDDLKAWLGAPQLPETIFHVYKVALPGHALDGYTIAIPVDDAVLPALPAAPPEL